jgi:SAM-dependent methyltransferase
MCGPCPLGPDLPPLRARVRSVPERAALRIDGDLQRHRGAGCALEHLGYDRAELAALPAQATARFAGAGNPLRVGPVHTGETVIDHACGAGLDLLLAARRVGPAGHAIGVDADAEILASARHSAGLARLTGVVDIREGRIEALPVGDESADLVISNGVLNLAPDQARVLEEVHRVLKPGGRLYLAAVVARPGTTPRARIDGDAVPKLLAGALQQADLSALALRAGLRDARIVETVDGLPATAAEHERSDPGPITVHFFARKPDAPRRYL